MALAGNTVYVVTCDLAVTVTKLNQVFGSSTDGPATGEVEALNLGTGKVEWHTNVPDLPLGASTVSNDLVFTTLYGGVLIALNRNTGAIVYRRQLPTSTNSPIAIAGNTVLVSAGGPTDAITRPIRGGNPQLVAYTAP
jgi:outer membrane protein assembly factor BamB